MIDAHGQVSRQQDIILYEEDMCPVFRVLLASRTVSPFHPC